MHLMLRPVPSSRALRALRAQLSFEPYTCSSCIHSSTSLARTGRARQFPNPRHASNLAPRARQLGVQQQRRRYANVAPVTSVNAARSVPDKNRELHKALTVLETAAPEYVNLSMLALALRGLETKDPITRVAIQSSAPRTHAKRLIRLLLADLSSPEQDWEAFLNEEDGDERAILIRYAEYMDIDASNPLVRVLTLPAKSLERHRLEFLLISHNEEKPLGHRPRRRVEDSLVQTIETPISTTGRYSQVTYPVHKVVFHGKGINGVLSTEFDEIQAEPRATTWRHAAIELSQANPEQPLKGYGLNLINIEQAESALLAMRQSSNNAAGNEGKWQGSFVPKISEFVFNGILPSTTLKPLHRAFISEILDTAESGLAADEKAHSGPSPEALEASLAPIQEAITLWSESAHLELRNELTNAFAGGSWGSLVWWKLPFRVDDIGVMGSRILNSFYLADAEKGMIWVGGRMEEAGLTNTTAYAKKTVRLELEAEERRRVQGIEPLNRDIPLSYFSPLAPWPQQIRETRQRLLQETLPALQARAQRLLLEVISGSSLSAAVGALAYTMVSSTGIFEAGAIAAFGTAVCITRLQQQWDRAREAFRRNVENSGRNVLEQVELDCREMVRRKIEESGRTPEEEGREGRDAAGEAVREARDALERLK